MKYKFLISKKSFFALICCFSLQFLAFTGSASTLQGKFRALVNGMTADRAKDVLSIRFADNPFIGLRNAGIDKDTALIGLDNLSKKILNKKGPFNPARDPFIFAWEPSAYTTNDALIIAALAKICGAGNVLKYDTEAHNFCWANNRMAKMFDYVTPANTKIPVTVYSMFDTILKNADSMKNQPNQSQDFELIYTNLSNILDDAAKPAVKK